MMEGTDAGPATGDASRREAMAWETGSGDLESAADRRWERLRSWERSASLAVGRAVLATLAAAGVVATVAALIGILRGGRPL